MLDAVGVGLAEKEEERVPVEVVDVVADELIDCSPEMVRDKVLLELNEGVALYDTDKLVVAVTEPEELDDGDWENDGENESEADGVALVLGEFDCDDE